MPTFTADTLQVFGTRLLVASGLRPAGADLVVSLLIKSDLQDYPAHGIAHLPSYLERIKEGLMDVAAVPEVVRDGPSYALIDGRFAFGQLVAHQAMSLAIEKARDHGIAVVGATHSGHMGRLADYVEMAVEAGLVGIAMLSVSSASIPAHGGITGVAGTNPMAFGVPGRDGRHFILDFATAALSRGELGRRIALGEPIPEGILLDADGNPTTDAEIAGRRAILLPFGGYKGSGLHLVTELLGGILTGHGAGREWSSQGPGGAINAGYFQAIDPELFRPLDDFTNDVGDFLDFVKSGTPRPGFEEIFIPGERARAAAARNLAEGITIDDHAWPRLAEWADQLGVPAPSIGWRTEEG